MNIEVNNSNYIIYYFTIIDVYYYSLHCIICNVLVYNGSDR